MEWLEGRVFNQFLRSTFTDLAGLVPRELAVLYSVLWVCSGWARVSPQVYSCLVGDYSFREHSDPLGLESYYSDPLEQKYRAAVCSAESGPANSGYQDYFARKRAMMLRS
jgi:hypothetical protein